MMRRKNIYPLRKLSDFDTNLTGWNSWKMHGKKSRNSIGLGLGFAVKG